MTCAVFTQKTILQTVKIMFVNELGGLHKWDGGSFNVENNLFFCIDCDDTVNVSPDNDLGFHLSKSVWHSTKPRDTVRPIEF